MNPEVATLVVDVAFDPEKTDAESLASAFDRLLETIMSTPGILDDYGQVSVSGFTLKEDVAFNHDRKLAAEPVAKELWEEGWYDPEDPHDPIQNQRKHGLVQISRVENGQVYFRTVQPQVIDKQDLGSELGSEEHPIPLDSFMRYFSRIDGGAFWAFKVRSLLLKMKQSSSVPDDLKKEAQELLK